MTVNCTHTSWAWRVGVGYRCNNCGVETPSIERVEQLAGAAQACAQAEAHEGRAGKKDTGKPRYTLLPWRGLDQVVSVLEHGVAKYGGEGSWREVPDAKRIYLDAALRHVAAIARGELLDADSGLPHHAHAVASLLFILELE